MYQVQRCFRDETVLITTYEGNHNHSLPPAARPMASSTSAALKMFLSGSTTSLHGSTLPNSHLFSSLSTSGSTGLVTLSPSATCPTITLDLTQPSNRSYLQFQRANTNSLDHRQFFPLPLHGYNNQTTYEGLYLTSKLPNIIPQEKNLALMDIVSEAIAKDPSLKAALESAVSSITGGSGGPQNINNHNQSSESGYDPYSKMPAIYNTSSAPHYSIDLE
ncbi:hypothetical protein RIF29_09309 [Crotalaria pallida]|uniref:WRKY domain-containing protein n=1 Tax=Crotalaria pallida TaxID=3830 RepID=A0AAN9FZF8_CROPI